MTQVKSHISLFNRQNHKCRRLHKDFPSIEQSIQIQENSLQLLTGNLPGNIHRNTSLTDIRFNDTLATGLPMAILNRRPDVRADELLLVKANAQVGISQAG